MDMKISSLYPNTSCTNKLKVSKELGVQSGQKRLANTI